MFLWIGTCQVYVDIWLIWWPSKNKDGLTFKLNIEAFSCEIFYRRQRVDQGYRNNEEEKIPLSPGSVHA
jgi:hypothetical protein